MNGFASPNHTQTPNDLFDVLLAQIDTLAELKVTLAVIRKTLGYHKKHDPISYTQLQKITGMNPQAVQDGVERAIARGTIKVVGTGKRGVRIFALVMHDYYEDHSGSTMQNIVTKETTQNKEKTIAGEPAAVDSKSEKPKKAREPNPIFDAVALGSFQLTHVNGDKTLGARIGKIVAWLKDQEDVTAERVTQFYAWYGQQNQKASAPRDVGKFAEWWAKFAAQGGDSEFDAEMDKMFETMDVVGGAPWEAQS